MSRAIILSLLCLANCLSVEITPGEQCKPYQLVHVRYSAENGGVVFVLGLKDGAFVTPDAVDVSPGYLVWTGPPGTYSVHGIEGGKRFNYLVEITGRDPAPPIVPPPAPDPQPLTKLERVLILEETSDRSRLPSAQMAALMSPQVRGYLTTHCAKGPDGKTPEWRMWDDDLTGGQLGFVTEVWRLDYAKAKADSNGRTPWLLINGGAGSMAFPASTTEACELLKKFGGE